MNEQSEKERVLAMPLWAVGLPIAALGLVRRRPLVVALGLTLFFSDSRASEVRRIRVTLRP